MITVKEMQELAKKSLMEALRNEERKRNEIREKIETSIKNAALQGKYNVDVVLKADEIGCWNTVLSEYAEFMPQDFGQRVTFTWEP